MAGFAEDAVLIKQSGLELESRRKPGKCRGCLWCWNDQSGGPGRKCYERMSEYYGMERGPKDGCSVYEKKVGRWPHEWNEEQRGK